MEVIEEPLYVILNRNTHQIESYYLFTKAQAKDLISKWSDIGRGIAVREHDYEIVEIHRFGSRSIG